MFLVHIRWIDNLYDKHEKSFIRVQSFTIFECPTWNYTPTWYLDVVQVWRKPTILFSRFSDSNTAALYYIFVIIFGDLPKDQS